MQTEPEPRSIGSQFRSLRDQVIDNLRERIIEGELASGQKLVERDLADELEVSRITVREALQQLANEGFITLLPRRGTAVTEFGATEIRNLLEVREPLEVLAARLAAQRRDDAGLARLGAHLDAARDALARDDRRDAAVANVAFHEEIVKCADNTLLLAHMSSLHGQLRRLFRMTRELDTDHVHDHDALLAAIRDKDAQLAAELATKHIQATTDGTLTVLGISVDRTQN